MGDKASRSCCGCIVQTLGGSKFLRLEGFGDFVDFLPGTTFVSIDPVRDKLAAAGETFLRLNRCGPAEHLVVRLLANAELVNDGTEAEPDYTLGDHLFVELQTPVASRLVNHQLQPLWVIRVGAGGRRGNPVARPASQPDASRFAATDRRHDRIVPRTHALGLVGQPEDLRSNYQRPLHDADA